MLSRGLERGRPRPPPGAGAGRPRSDQDDKVVMSSTIALYHCSESEIAAVRQHVDGWAHLVIHDSLDELDPASDFAILGSFVVTRRALLSVVREKLHDTPTLLLLDHTATDPMLADDFAALGVTEMHRLPYIVRRELLFHRSERALRESERRYRDLVETAREGVWQVDAGGTTTFANRRMAELLGSSVAELSGTSIFDYVDPEMSGLLVDAMQVLGGGRSDSRDLRFR